MDVLDDEHHMKLSEVVEQLGYLDIFFVTSSVELEIDAQTDEIEPGDDPPMSRIAVKVGKCSHCEWPHLYVDRDAFDSALEILGYYRAENIGESRPTRH